VASQDDAPPAIQWLFWRLVFVCNVALFALSVGVMFVGFLGDWRRGIALVAVGVGAFLYAYWRYRYERRHGVLAPDPGEREGNG